MRRRRRRSSRYLLRLVELELIDRERRMVERRIKAARFPAVKSLDTFDFTAIPSLNKMLVLELARCEFILRRENVIALGPRRSRFIVPISLSSYKAKIFWCGSTDGGRRWRRASAACFTVASSRSRARITQGAPLQCCVAGRIFSCIRRRTVASLTLRTAAASSSVTSPRSARSPSR